MIEKDTKIILDNFEGPLDLLLYLIQRDEVDILNLKVAKIADQFSDILSKNKSDSDISISSDYMLMGSDLIYLKSKELLPEKSLELELNEYEDPKLDLIKQLIEYKKYKDIALELQKLEEEEKKIYPTSEKNNKKVEDRELQVALLKVVDSFQRALKKIENESNSTIYDDKFTIKGQETVILNILEESNIELLVFFFKIKNKYELITTFLAVLELTKVGVIKIELIENSTFIVKKS